MALTLAGVRLSAESQPGGRRPAPGELALVQAFANTFWDLERRRPERLRTPAALARWLRERELLEPGVRLTEADRWQALDVREGIRALLFANSGHDLKPDALRRMHQALPGGLLVRLHADHRPEFVAPRRDLDGALALIAAAVAVAQLEGRFTHLKACPGPECGWAFYDHSRNQTGAWCSMSVCGARVKAREYRARRRRSPGHDGA